MPLAGMERLIGGMRTDTTECPPTLRGNSDFGKRNLNVNATVRFRRHSSGVQWYLSVSAIPENLNVPDKTKSIRRTDQSHRRIRLRPNRELTHWTPEPCLQKRPLRSQRFGSVFRRCELNLNTTGVFGGTARVSNGACR